MKEPKELQEITLNDVGVIEFGEYVPGGIQTTDVPAEVLTSLQTAVKRRHWITYVVSIDEENEMHMERTAMAFPSPELNLALDMISKDIAKMKGT
jgi:hypothetical protein